MVAVQRARRNVVLPDKPPELIAYEALLRSTSAGTGEPYWLDGGRSYQGRVLARVRDLRRGDNVWTARICVLFRTRGYRTNPSDISELTDFVLSAEDLIDAVRDIAYAEEPLVMPDPSEGDAADISYQLDITTCCELLTTRAVSESYNGRPKLAVEDLLAAMALADKLGQNPFYGSLYYRQSMYRGALRTLSDCVHVDSFPTECASELVARLETAAWRDRFANSLIVEAYVAQATFSSFRPGGPLPYYATGSDLQAWYTEAAYASQLRRFLTRGELQTYADAMARLSNIVRAPYLEGEQEFEQFTEWIASVPERYMYFHLGMPMRLRAPRVQAAHEGMLRLAQIGISLEQYRRAHGSYPLDLAQALLWQTGDTPLDPLTGREFFYERSEDDFLLYGVGINLVDDGGVADYEKGDLVWRNTVVLEDLGE